MKLGSALAAAGLAATLAACSQAPAQSTAPSDPWRVVAAGNSVGAWRINAETGAVSYCYDNNGVIHCDGAAGSKAQ